MRLPPFHRTLRPWRRHTALITLLTLALSNTAFAASGTSTLRLRQEEAEPGTSVLRLPQEEAGPPTSVLRQVGLEESKDSRDQLTVALAGPNAGNFPGGRVASSIAAGGLEEGEWTSPAFVTSKIRRLQTPNSPWQIYEYNVNGDLDAEYRGRSVSDLGIEQIESLVTRAESGSERPGLVYVSEDTGRQILRVSATDEIDTTGLEEKAKVRPQDVWIGVVQGGDTTVDVAGLIRASGNSSIQQIPADHILPLDVSTSPINQFRFWVTTTTRTAVLRVVVTPYEIGGVGGKTGLDLASEADIATKRQQRTEVILVSATPRGEWGQKLRIGVGAFEAKRRLAAVVAEEPKHLSAKLAAALDTYFAARLTTGLEEAGRVMTVDEAMALIGRINPKVTTLYFGEPVSRRLPRTGVTTLNMSIVRDSLGQMADLGPVFLRQPSPARIEISRPTEPQLLEGEVQEISDLLKGVRIGVADDIIRPGERFTVTISSRKLGLVSDFSAITVTVKRNRASDRPVPQLQLTLTRRGPQYTQMLRNGRAKFSEVTTLVGEPRARQGWTYGFQVQATGLEELEQYAVPKELTTDGWKSAWGEPSEEIRAARATHEIGLRDLGDGSDKSATAAGEHLQDAVRKWDDAMQVARAQLAGAQLETDPARQQYPLGPPVNVLELARDRAAQALAFAKTQATGRPTESSDQRESREAGLEEGQQAVAELTRRLQEAQQAGRFPTVQQRLALFPDYRVPQDPALWMPLKRVLDDPARFERLLQQLAAGQTVSIEWGLELSVPSPSGMLELKAPAGNPSEAYPAYTTFSAALQEETIQRDRRVFWINANGVHFQNAQGQTGQLADGPPDGLQQLLTDRNQELVFEVRPDAPQEAWAEFAKLADPRNFKSVVDATTLHTPGRLQGYLIHQDWGWWQFKHLEGFAAAPDPQAPHPRPRFIVVARALSLGAFPPRSRFLPPAAGLEEGQRVVGEFRRWLAGAIWDDPRFGRDPAERSKIKASIPEDIAHDPGLWKPLQRLLGDEARKAQVVTTLADRGLEIEYVLTLTAPGVTKTAALEARPGQRYTTFDQYRTFGEALRQAVDGRDLRTLWINATGISFRDAQGNAGRLDLGVPDGLRQLLDDRNQEWVMEVHRGVDQAIWREVASLADPRDFRRIAPPSALASLGIHPPAIGPYRLPWNDREHDYLTYLWGFPAAPDSAAPVHRPRFIVQFPAYWSSSSRPHFESLFAAPKAAGLEETPAVPKLDYAQGQPLTTLQEFGVVRIGSFLGIQRDEATHFYQVAQQWTPPPILASQLAWHEVGADGKLLETTVEGKPAKSPTWKKISDLLSQSPRLLTLATGLEEPVVVQAAVATIVAQLQDQTVDRAIVHMPTGRDVEITIASVPPAWGLQLWVNHNVMTAAGADPAGTFKVVMRTDDRTLHVRPPATGLEEREQAIRAIVASFAEPLQPIAAQFLHGEAPLDVAERQYGNAFSQLSRGAGITPGLSRIALISAEAGMLSRMSDSLLLTALSWKLAGRPHLDDVDSAEHRPMVAYAEATQRLATFTTEYAAGETAPFLVVSAATVAQHAELAGLRNLHSHVVVADAGLTPELLLASLDRVQPTGTIALDFIGTLEELRDVLGRTTAGRLRLRNVVLLNTVEGEFLNGLMRNWGAQSVVNGLFIGNTAEDRLMVILRNWLQLLPPTASVDLDARARQMALDLQTRTQV